MESRKINGTVSCTGRRSLQGALTATARVHVEAAEQGGHGIGLGTNLEWAYESKSLEKSYS